MRRAGTLATEEEIRNYAELAAANSELQEAMNNMTRGLLNDFHARPSGIYENDGGRRKRNGSV